MASAAIIIHHYILPFITIRSTHHTNINEPQNMNTLGDPFPTERWTNLVRLIHSARNSGNAFMAYTRAISTPARPAELLRALPTTRPGVPHQQDEPGAGWLRRLLRHVGTTAGQALDAAGATIEVWAALVA
ncbi:hypothetical protein HGRIS_013813 [Hohenbuehelia grisea]|uniref:Uncharacterized protein n=1 Tax=Hohenbuehelia grisea TaxID=104357 RepID=A0ABR3IWR8_9AGAR